MEQPAGQFNNVSEQFVQERLPVGWPWRLMISFGVIFAFTIFVYAGLKFGYETSLSDRSKQADSDLKQLTEQVNASEAEKEQFVGFYSQIANLKSVLEKHGFLSNSFSFLEKNTLPILYYTDAEIKAQSNQIILKGIADSLETVSGQITTFQKQAEIETAVFKDVNFQGQNVAFSLTLNLKSGFFQKPSIPQ